jgi:hypothetical protein
MGAQCSTPGREWQENRPPAIKVNADLAGRSAVFSFNPAGRRTRRDSSDLRTRPTAHFQPSEPAPCAALRACPERGEGSALVSASSSFSRAPNQTEAQGPLSGPAAISAARVYAAPQRNTARWKNRKAAKRALRYIFLTRGQSPKGATCLSPGQRPGDQGAATAASPERASYSVAPSGLRRGNGLACLLTQADGLGWDGSPLQGSTARLAARTALPTKSRGP